MGSGDVLQGEGVLTVERIRAVPLVFRAVHGPLFHHHARIGLGGEGDGGVVGHGGAAGQRGSSRCRAQTAAIAVAIGDLVGLIGEGDENLDLFIHAGLVEFQRVAVSAVPLRICRGRTNRDRPLVHRPAAVRRGDELEAVVHADLAAGVEGKFGAAGVDVAGGNRSVFTGGEIHRDRVTDIIDVGRVEGDAVAGEEVCFYSVIDINRGDSVHAALGTGVECAILIQVAGDGHIVSDRDGAGLALRVGDSQLDISVCRNRVGGTFRAAPSGRDGDGNLVHHQHGGCHGFAVHTLGGEGVAARRAGGIAAVCACNGPAVHLIADAAGYCTPSVIGALFQLQRDGRTVVADVGDLLVALPQREAIVIGGIVGTVVAHSRAGLGRGSGGSRGHDAVESGLRSRPGDLCAGSCRELCHRAGVRVGDGKADRTDGEGDGGGQGELGANYRGSDVIVHFLLHGDGRELCAVGVFSLTVVELGAGETVEGSSRRSSTAGHGVDLIMVVAVISVRTQDHGAVSIFVIHDAQVGSFVRLRISQRKGNDFAIHSSGVVLAIAGVEPVLREGGTFVGGYDVPLFVTDDDHTNIIGSCHVLINAVRAVEALRDGVLTAHILDGIVQRQCIAQLVGVAGLRDGAICAAGDVVLSVNFVIHADKRIVIRVLIDRVFAAFIRNSRRDIYVAAAGLRLDRRIIRHARIRCVDVSGAAGCSGYVDRRGGVQAAEIQRSNGRIIRVHIACRGGHGDHAAQAAAVEARVDAAEGQGAACRTLDRPNRITGQLAHAEPAVLDAHCAGLEELPLIREGSACAVHLHLDVRRCAGALQGAACQRAAIQRERDITALRLGAHGDGGAVHGLHGLPGLVIAHAPHHIGVGLVGLEAGELEAGLVARHRADEYILGGGITHAVNAELLGGADAGGPAQGDAVGGEALRRQSHGGGGRGLHILHQIANHGHGAAVERAVPRGKLPLEVVIAPRILAGHYTRLGDRAAADVGFLIGIGEAVGGAGRDAADLDKDVLRDRQIIREGIFLLPADGLALHLGA